MLTFVMNNMEYSNEYCISEKGKYFSIDVLDLFNITEVKR